MTEASAIKGGSMRKETNYTRAGLARVLCKHPDTADEVANFLSSDFYSRWMGDVVTDTGALKQYSRDLGAWVSGKKKVVVFPNELCLLRFLARPAVVSALTHRPEVLLAALCTLLGRCRAEGHRLSELETLVYLDLNAKGVRWTSRTALLERARAWRKTLAIATEAATKRSMANLATSGILENREGEYRVALKYRG